MTGQPPRKASTNPIEQNAKDAAKRAQDIADAMQEMSTMSVVSRSRATLLQLEARTLRNALEKKSQETSDDVVRAQRLLHDVTTLRDATLAKARAARGVASSKRRVTLVDAPAYVEDKQPLCQPDSSEHSAVGIRDETVKDEECRALLRRASVYSPDTGSTVMKPDADIMAIVAKKIAEKTSSANSTPRRSPVLSQETTGLQAKATVPTATGKRRSLATSKPSRDSATGPRPTETGQLKRSPATSKTSQGRVSPTASPTSSGKPSPTPSKYSAVAAWSSRRESPVASRQPSPVTSQHQIETVPQQRVKVLHAGTLPTPQPSPVHPAMPTTRRKARATRQVRMTPSMVREKDELDKVIKNLMKTAEAEVEENPAQVVITDALVASILASDTRSVETENLYSTLRRSARRNPVKFIVRTCCSLLLLGLTVVFVVLTIIYGNRVLMNYSAGKAPPKLQAHNQSGTLVDVPHARGNLRSDGVDPVSHASLQDLSSVGADGTRNVTVEAPYYNDEILDIS
ncbi:prophage side tail fiber protein homolog StfR-like isoform X2 [Dermacentor albipictus]|uniref:prophage side tail fiber protein homolog StfR-like isoform X2 n=1 Tax=Dermacentor albipictus TaxID=60249 RepID=UPI0038FC5375